MKEKPQVFLSYAREDLKTVRRIYEGLKKRNIKVWINKEDLGPGRWKPKITKAIARSRYFVICISHAALKKTGDDTPGFQDEELNTAYQIAQDQGDQKFSIIPVRLEDCDQGDFRLTSFQQYDLFEDFEGGLDRLALDLGGQSLEGKKPSPILNETDQWFESFRGRSETAYYSGDFEKALDYLDIIIEQNPNDVEALNTKGAVLGELGKYDEVLSISDKIIELDRRFPDSWINKGVVFAKLKRFEEALSAFNHAITLKEDSSFAWDNKVLVLTKLKHPQEVLLAIKKAQTLGINIKTKPF